MKSIRILGIVMLSAIAVGTVQGQYNEEVAGKNRIYKTEIKEVELKNSHGEIMYSDDGIVLMDKIEVKTEVEADSFGNANGSEYDLATDGAFEGNTIAVLNLNGSGVPLNQLRGSVKQKGLSVFQWDGAPPAADILKEELKKASQLWIISSGSNFLTEAHVEVIAEFFDSGKGLYVWGDNDPYYADANFVLERIFNTTMGGNTYAGETVGVSGEAENRAGVVDGHLICTGVSNVYEGITVATVEATQELSPLIYGSGDNLVAAVYEKDGKRAIIDGGFTRLQYINSTAGTDRYIKNAASWLVNYERFGEDVYSEKKNN